MPNKVKNFQATAIIVKDSQKPSHVYDHTATSHDPKAKGVDVQGPSEIV